MFGQISPYKQRRDWLDVAWLQPGSSTNASTKAAPITPVPGTGAGPFPEIIGSPPIHVTIVVASTSLVYQIHHDLNYAPTAVWAIQQLAEGTTPTGVYAVEGITGGYSPSPPFPANSRSAGIIQMMFSQPGTWDIFFR